MDVTDRMSSGFSAGAWVGFTSAKKTGTIPIPGSIVFADDGTTEYHMTNMELSYTIELGQFTADPSEDIIGDAHLIQSGTSYKIPFKVNVIFTADTDYFVEGEMQTVFARGSTLHGSDIYVPAALEHEIGGAGVGNGTAELFNPALGGGFSILLFGPTFGPTAPNTIYFSELNIAINATSLATLPTWP
jgi:hypothetical protein